MSGVTTDERLKAIELLHAPFGIYDECVHEQHEPDDPGVIYSDDLGLTCAHLYDICRECCSDGDGQGPWCGEGHDHGPDKPICATRAILDATKEGAR